MYYLIKTELLLVINAMFTVYFNKVIEISHYNKKHDKLLISMSISFIKTL